MMEETTSPYSCVKTLTFLEGHHVCRSRPITFCDFEEKLACESKNVKEHIRKNVKEHIKISCSGRIGSSHV